MNLLKSVLVLLNAVSFSFAGDPVKVRVAYTAKAYYAPQFLALKNSWVQAPGYQFEEVNLGMSAGVAAAEALLSGSADMAVMGDVPAIISITSPRKCVIVGAYGGGERMHSILLPQNSSIHKVTDFLGKKVGVQFGSSTHGALSMYFKKHGMDAKSVQLVNISQKDLMEALVSGSVDAIAASDPTPMMTLKKVPGSKLFAELTALANNYPSVIVTTEDFANKHPQAVKALVKGTQKTIEWILADPKAVAQASIQTTGTPLDVELATYQKMEWKLRWDAEVIQSLQNMSQFLFESGKIKKLPDLKALSRPDLLK